MKINKIIAKVIKDLSAEYDIPEEELWETATKLKLKLKESQT